MDEKQALVCKASAGDRDAYTELVRTYHVAIRAFVARAVPIQEDVDDIAQETFLDAFRQIRQFDPDRKFSSWLYAICRNKIRNYFRAKRSERNTGLALVDSSIENLEPAEETCSDRVVALRKCIEELQEQHREIIRLRYRAGLAVRTIASQVQRSAAAVSMMLSRIRTALTRCVERGVKPVVEP